MPSRKRKPTQAAMTNSTSTPHHPGDPPVGRWRADSDAVPRGSFVAVLGILEGLAGRPPAPWSSRRDRMHLVELSSPAESFERSRALRLVRFFLRSVSSSGV